MIQAIIPSVIALFTKAIDKGIEDKDQAALLKAKMITEVNTMASQELKGAVDIIVAEAKGDSWLQRSWRPISMLFMLGLVGAHWLGFTAPNVTEDVTIKLLNIVQIGLGGYIVGRSGEKIVKELKK